jgi:hypothetical protein
MKRHTSAAACLAVIVAGTAQAQSLPRYDVSSYCRMVSDVSGGSSMIYSGCIDMEQDAYNDLKSRWASISSTTISYCQEVASVSGGTYMILNGCIDMEQDAAGGDNSFKY